MMGVVQKKMKWNFSFDFLVGVVFHEDATK